MIKYKLKEEVKKLKNLIETKKTSRNIYIFY